nr:Hsp70 family protein [Micromonospora sp. DSM 115978]
HDLVDHASLHDCGGRDLDHLLYQEIRALGGGGLESMLGGPYGAGTGDGGGGSGGYYDETTIARTSLELADFARTVKHQLTDVEVVEDVFGPAGLLVTVDRMRFTQLAAPSLARTLSCCLQLVHNAGTVPEKLAGVLVVGGSTRLPVVTDMLAGAVDVGAGWTGQRLFTVADPELAVVEGAAAWAAAVSTRRAPASRPTSVVQPAKWEIPGEPATLVRWLVEPGVRYEADAVLARVRLPDGSLFDLTADAPGRLLHHQALPGTPVT